MTVVTAAGSAASTATGASKGLAGNFDTFLKLLTTQLRQQDPLSPMDATTFTSQLVQFASVEQAIQTNTRLGELTAMAEAGSVAPAMGLLGQEVTAGTDELTLGSEGGATIRYRLPKDAAEATVTLLDAKGRTVATLAGGKAAGENEVAWDGAGADGGRVAAGTYTVRVTAKAADGSAIAAEQFVRGRAEAIERAGGELQLRVAGALVPLGAVSLIREPVRAA